MRPDRFLHLAVSATIAVLVGFLTTPILGFFAALVVGAGKEIWDLSKGKHDQKEAWMDMLFNFIGALAASLVVYFGNNPPPDVP